MLPVTDDRVKVARKYENIVNQSHPNLVAAFVHQHLVGPAKLVGPLSDFCVTLGTPHWSHSR